MLVLAWMLRWPKDLALWIEFKPANERLVRIVAMLTKLLMRFDPELYPVRKIEAIPTPATPSEHEHDDEHD